MGCDGDTIPTRDELVKTKKNPEKKDKDSVRIYKWQHCHLTQDQLVRPIVACELGKLYNKEAIIKNLLRRKNVDSQEEYVAANASVDHVRSLKDIKELILTEKSEKANIMADNMKARRTKAKLLKKLAKEGKQKRKTDNMSSEFCEPKRSKLF